MENKKMNIPFIDLSRLHTPIRKELDRAIQSVTTSNDYILGDDVERFEEEFASYCGMKYATGVGNGTDGLLMSLRALGIGPGDEVITTPFSFIASTLPIIYAGATPVFADILPD